MHNLACADRNSVADWAALQLVLAPLSMVAFIISLILVDEQERQWRLSQRASNPSSIWYRLTHWPESHPVPYQESGTSAWGYRSKVPSPPTQKPAQSSQSWYACKKKGTIARLEIGDALEMRGRVLVALIAWALLGTLASYYAIRLGYNWILS